MDPGDRTILAGDREMAKEIAWELRTFFLISRRRSYAKMFDRK
jgi:hypothetical protein